MADYNDEEDQTSIDAETAAEEAAAAQAAKTAAANDEDSITLPAAAAAPAMAPGMRFSPAAIAGAVNTATGQTAPLSVPGAPAFVSQVGSEPPAMAAPRAPAIANLSNTSSQDKRSTSSADPLSARNLLSSTQQVAEADKAVAEKTAEANSAQQNAVVAAQDFQREQLAHQQAKEEARRQIIGKKNDTLNQLQQDYEKATIDPNHYWKNQPIGSKIMSLVAIGLSGLGNAYAAAASPGANPHANGAWDIIKGQIDNDIDAQKANLAKQGHAIGARSTELANLRNQLGDERVADAAFAAQQYGAFAKTAEAEALKSNNPITIANGQRLAATANQAASEKLFDATKSITEHADNTVNRQVVAKTAALSVDSKGIERKLQLQQSAVDAQEAIDQIQANEKKDGRFGSAVQSLLAKHGLSAAPGYNELNTDKGVLFLNEARALLGNRLSQQGLLEMAKANPNMFNDPHVFISALQSFRNNNRTQANNMNIGYENKKDIGNDLPAFLKLDKRIKADELVKKYK